MNKLKNDLEESLHALGVHQSGQAAEVAVAMFAEWLPSENEISRELWDALGTGNVRDDIKRQQIIMGIIRKHFYRDETELIVDPLIHTMRED